MFSLPNLIHDKILDESTLRVSWESSDNVVAAVLSFEHERGLDILGDECNRFFLEMSSVCIPSRW